MANPFQCNPDESILYRSRPSRDWYSLAWRIGGGILGVFIFSYLSIISFINIGNTLLARMLPIGMADGISRVIFQGILPILVIAWFAEDTATIFTSELIFTNQRIWTRGSPYAWTAGQETPLADIASISRRRDAVIIHRKSTRRVQVLMFPNGKQIVEAYTQFVNKTGTN